jgi:beta-lactamase regulating signal transducer with metallopeptidase domain
MTAALSLAGAAGAAELLIRATLLIGGAWAAAAALRAAGASAAARHMAWLLGIAALLALPLVWWLAPALRLPILPEAATMSAASAAPLAALAPPGLAGSVAAGLPQQVGWIGLSLLGYALGAAALLLRIAIARRVLARVWSEADRVADPVWQDLLSDLSLEMQLPRRVELRIAKGSAMPMTWGTLEPRVLLPAEALAWPNERRRLVLLHELAHVARRDSLSRSVASLACALYWFHPGAWFAARRMFMEQEHAADDRVLTAGGSARAYARSLLHLATPDDGMLRPAHAASMAGMYQLERRLVSIINPARRDRPTSFFLTSSALAASLATLVVAAGVPVGSSSASSWPLRAEPAGIDSAGIVPSPRAAATAPEAGALVADAQREAEPKGLTEEPGQPQTPVYTRSLSDNRGQAGDGASASEARAGEPARQSDHATSANTASPGPAIPAILARGEPFTLSPATPNPAFRLVERAPFRLASNEPTARPAATPTVPRSVVDPAQTNSRRVASWRRLNFTMSWVEPGRP